MTSDPHVAEVLEALANWALEDPERPQVLVSDPLPLWQFLADWTPEVLEVPLLEDPSRPEPQLSQPLPLPGWQFLADWALEQQEWPRLSPPLKESCRCASSVSCCKTLAAIPLAAPAPLNSRSASTVQRLLPPEALVTLAAFCVPPLSWQEAGSASVG